MEAVRAYFDGGVNIQDADKIKHKVGSAYVIQSAERIEESTEKMRLKTVVKVAKVLLDDAPITQAECTAAVEAARAICGLARTGRICFDLDGHLIEDWNGKKTRTGNRMKEDCEDRWKRKTKDEEADLARISHSVSTSVLVGISDPFSAEKMTSQKHHNLGAKPKWSAHADLPYLGNDESSTTPIPPWRDKSLWLITTTRTVGGLLLEEPSRGVKQKLEELYEVYQRSMPLSMLN